MFELDAPLSRRNLARLFGASAAWAAVAPLVSEGRILAEAGPAKPTPQPAGKTIRLSANENPYGPPPAALQAIESSLALACRYPDDEVRRLTAQLAAAHGVAPDSIRLGDGSSQSLHAAVAAWAGPERAVATADPTFEAVGHYAEVRGARVTRVALTRDYRHDLGAMAKAVGEKGLLYICNPNNPTATLTPAGEIRRLLARLPPTVTVLVDEAYHDYAVGTDGYQSVIGWTREFPNLVVTRTFSKIYGMAGLRCGYAVAAPPTLAKLARRLPWDALNLAALVAARAALGEKAYLERSRRLNDEVRASTVAGFARRGFQVIPSCANFVMVELGRDVAPVVTGLAARGVEVGRRFPAMPSHLRLTLGTAEEMRGFFAAFDEVLGVKAAA